MFCRAFLLLSLLVSGLRAQNFIHADFSTTEGDFTVSLDYLKAPLAVANFIQLAGKGDDIFETPVGATVPFITESAHYGRSFYRTTAASDTDRSPLALNIRLLQNPLTLAQTYGVFQSDTLLGEVEAELVDRRYFKDVTGEDRLRVELIEVRPTRYRITIRYPRPWVDARTAKVRAAPMYRAMRINRVETGKRFFAGDMTGSRQENPGYEFQDEILIQSGTSVAPFGAPFNSAGVLAMDTLAPNRNGSRFFITSTADPSLNGRHTAFGSVLPGIGAQVVANIASTQTEGDQEPVRNMFIRGINIRRGGLLANAFFEQVYQATLPGLIAPLCLSFQRDASQFSLVAPARPSSLVSLYTSTDLIQYNGGFITPQPPSSLQPLRTDFSVTSMFSPKLFVQALAADLPTWPSQEIQLENSRFTFRLTSGTDVGTLVIALGAEQTDEFGVPTGFFFGSYNIQTIVQQSFFDPNKDAISLSSSGSGTFTATYDSTQGPYRGVLNFTNALGELNVDQVTLHFDSTRFFQNSGIPLSQSFRRFDARTTDPERDFLSYSGIFLKNQ